VTDELAEADIVFIGSSDKRIVCRCDWYCNQWILRLMHSTLHFVYAGNFPTSPWFARVSRRENQLAMLSLIINKINDGDTTLLGHLVETVVLLQLLLHTLHVITLKAWTKIVLAFIQETQQVSFRLSTCLDGVLNVPDLMNRSRWQY
jgi:hypothetical protein